MKLRHAAAALACALASLPTCASALDLIAGVSLGSVLAGVEPRVAVTPHVAIAWRADNGLILAARDMFSILPAPSRGGVGVGVYNHLSAEIGYGWEAGSFSLGPSVSVYSMPACNPVLCGRIVGLSAGGHAQLTIYVVGPLGLSGSATIEWMGGASSVVRNNLAATFVAGPVVRWSMP